MTETEIANLAISHFGGKALVALTTDTTAQAVSARKWFDNARDEVLRSHPWNFARKRARLETTYAALSGVALADSGALDEFRVTATSHGLTTGMRIIMKDVEGSPAANGQWYITRIDANTFDLDDSVYSGSHTSGTGEWARIPLFEWDYWHDLPSDSLRILRCNGTDSADDDGEDFEIEDGKLLIDTDVVNVSYIFQNDTTTDWTSDFIAAFSVLLASYIAQDLTGPAGKAAELRASYEKLNLPKARGTDARETKPRTPPSFHHGSQLFASRFASTL